MDIGKLQAQITANPSGFQAGLAQASGMLETFYQSTVAMANRYGGAIANAMSAIGGPKVGAAISNAMSMFQGLTTLGATVGGPIGSAVAGVLAGTAAFFQFGQAGIAVVGQQARLGRQLGINTRDMMGLSFAAEASGIALDDQARTFAGFLRRTGQLQQHLGGQMPGQGQPPPMQLTGSNGAEHDQMAIGLRQLGINAQQFIALDVVGRLREVARGMDRIRGSGLESAVAFQIFGREGQAMMQLVGQGAAQLEARLAAGSLIGAWVSPADLALMEQAGKAMKMTGQVMDAIGRSLQLIAGASIAPIVIAFNELLVSVLKPLQTILAAVFIFILAQLAPVFLAIWITLKQLQAWAPVLEGIAILFKAVYDAALEVLGAFAPVANVISNIWTAITSGSGAAGIVTAAFTKIGQVISIIGAIAVATVKWVVDLWISAGRTILGSFGGFLDSIWPWFASRAMIAFSVIRTAIFGVLIPGIVYLYNAIAPVFASLWTTAKIIFDAIVATALMSWEAIKTAFMAVVAVFVIALTPLYEALVAVFGASFMQDFLAKLSSSGTWLTIFKAAIEGMLMPLIAVANIFANIAAGIQTMTAQMEGVTAQLQQMRALATGSLFGGGVGGIGGSLGGGGNAPTPGMFSSFFSNLFSPSNVASNINTPTGPLAQPATATGASRDSVDAVTAIIQNGLEPASDPQLDAANRAAEEARNSRTILEQIRDLLRPDDQPGIFSIGGM